MKNPLDFALQMEKDGEEYYRKQAAATSNQQIKQVFTTLAVDEKGHFETLSTIKATGKYQYVGSESLQEIKTIFAKEPTEGDDFRRDKGLADVYQEAVGFEKNSIALYKELAEKAVDKKERELFLRLVAEEEMHHSILWKLMELSRRPEEWYPYLNF